MVGESETLGASVGVVTVDDQAAFQRAARAVIDAAPGFELLGEAASGEDALALVADVDPELVLLDVRMPTMDGFETARRLRSAHPSAVVFLISTDDVDAQSCDASGAAAFLLKSEFCQDALRRLWDEHGGAAGS